MKYDKKKLIYQVILGIIYVALLAIFIYMCCSDGEKSTEQSSTVSEVVADVIENVTQEEVIVDDNFNHLVRKIIGHYGYFVLLGVVSSLFYYSFTQIKLYTRMIVNYVTGFTFAFISEFLLQAMTSGRTPSFNDVLIDYGGFITLSIIVSIIYLLFIENNQTNKEIC